MSLDDITLDASLTHNHAEMYVFDSSTATTITTTNTPHGINVFSAGHLNGYTFSSGVNGTITAFADYGGTVAGTVLATDIAHGLSTGDIITIEGGTNYLGVFEITKVDNDSFYFTDTWVANDGTVAWQQPDYITITKSNDVLLSSTLSVTPATSNDIFRFQIYINTLPITHYVSEEKLKSSTDIQSTSMSGVDPVTVGDKVWLGITNIGGTGDITIKHGNVTISEVS